MLFTYFVCKSPDICSSERPLVSGTRKYTKMTDIRQIPPYKTNVQDTPNTSKM